MTQTAINPDTMTVEEFIKCGSDIPVYLDTAWGFKRVSHIRWPETNPWAVCPEDNGGFGMSYCVHYGTTLHIGKGT